METWEKKLTRGLRVVAVGAILIMIVTIYAVGVGFANRISNIILFAEIMGLFIVFYGIWTLKAADIEKRRWDEASRILGMVKIKPGQVVYWRMDASTIMLVRVYKISVSPDSDTIVKYSAGSLFGNEICFTDEQIGKEIFVDLPNSEQDGDFGKEENKSSIQKQQIKAPYKEIVAMATKEKMKVVSHTTLKMEDLEFVIKCLREHKNPLERDKEFHILIVRAYMKLLEVTQCDIHSLMSRGKIDKILKKKRDEHKNMSVFKDARDPAELVVNAVIVTCETLACCKAWKMGCTSIKYAWLEREGAFVYLVPDEETDEGRNGTYVFGTGLGHVSKTIW